MMRLVILLSAILGCNFLCVISEKCQRRVCTLGLFRNRQHKRTLSRRQYPLYCTHLILHRAQLTSRQEIDLTVDEGLNEVHELIEIKRKNPHLKLILAIQNDNLVNFVKMYTNDENKKRFISNVIKYVRSKTIDGVNIDVQQEEGGNKEKFTQLFKDLMAAFSDEASRTKTPRLLLSVGIPSDKSFLDKYYDVLQISKYIFFSFFNKFRYVDMVDLATYSFVDLRKNISIQTPQHHSPLYSKDKSSTKIIDFMARYVAGKGVRKDKINIGLSFSVTEYFGDESTRTYLVSQWMLPLSWPCDLMHNTKPVYHQILEPDKGRLLTFNRVDGEFDIVKMFYDIPETIREKVKYVKANNYGGVLYYKVDDDDDSLYCKQGYFPLSKAAYEECSKS
ncbi:hypothetical protein Btru_053452 [Bulinus truncatus]|nr:hypothetical protein Btru_053452 [Bulinus truncatus]